MWKLFFEYSYKSKLTLTGKGSLDLDTAIEYHNKYGVHAEKAIYQQYPKKDNESKPLFELIEELEEESEV